MPGGGVDDDVQAARASGLFDPIAERLADGLPVFGTCAGMILLATDVLDGRPDQRSFGAIDIAVRRNGYGRQVDSFETDIDVVGLDEPFHAVFIRAPQGRARSAPASRCWPRTTASPCSPARAACFVAVVPSRADRRRPAPRAFLELDPRRSVHDRRRCPAIPSGQRSSTRRAPTTRPAASCSPSSPASSRSRPARAAATRHATPRCAPWCSRPRPRR